MHVQSPKTEIELQPHQQKSLESVFAPATNSSGTDIQSTEKSIISILCEPCNNCYYAHSHALQVNPRLKKLMLHNQYQVKQLTLVRTR